MPDRPVSEKDFKFLSKVILVMFVWLFLGVLLLNTVITVLPESYPPKLFGPVSVAYDTYKDTELEFCSKKPFIINIEGTKHVVNMESKKPYVYSGCLYSLDYRVISGDSDLKRVAIFPMSGAPHMYFYDGVAYVYLSVRAMRNVHFIMLFAIFLFGLFYVLSMWYRKIKKNIDAS